MRARALRVAINHRVSVKKAAILSAFLVILPTLGADAQGQLITFPGEVSQGQTFRRSIGHGLDFVLTAASWGDDITGWTIQVSPQGRVSDPECTDFAWVVTPPFRFQNVLYLDTSYGTTAQEAIRISPRDFNFVLNCDDYKAEYARVERVLWPGTYPKEEVDDALAKLGKIPHGTGRFWIKDSKYTPGDKSAIPVKLGAIHWIKFEVETKLPEDPRKSTKP